MKEINRESNKEVNIKDTCENADNEAKDEH